jgi:LacI family transcriptional regulator
VANRTKLSDVARLAGVSSATVSRVLNDNPQVDPALVSKVNEALARLSYRRNGLARGLRRQRNNVIGAVIPDVSNPFFTEVVRGIEDELRTKGFLVVLCNTDEDPAKEREYLELLIDQQAAGIIIAPSAGTSASLETARQEGSAVVVIDRSIGADFDTVVLDNAEASYALCLRLLKDYATVAHISGPLRTSTGTERAEGYRRALSSVGRVYDPRLLQESDYSEQGGYDAMSRLLDLDEPPTAVFVGNNVMSLGALRRLSETSSPIAIASFDPLPWNATSTQELVVLDHPSYQVGSEAAKLLIDRLGGSDAPVKRVVLPGGTPVTQG